MGCTDCGTCGSSFPHRINTDSIKLRNLKNITYTNIDSKKVSNFEIVHFQLYYLCPKCGFYTTFEKDEAPYAAIRFMANYHCYNCLQLCGIEDGFMVRVSPDKGINKTSGVVTISEDDHMARMQALNSFYEADKSGITYGHS